MPSPISVVLKDLLMEKKLSHEQWLNIVESRRAVIARCLDMFTLQTLEQLACLSSGNGSCHELRRDNPTIIDESGTLAGRRQGIFAGTPFARTASENTCRTFGLSRRNDWLLIEIEFSKQPDFFPVLGDYEKAVSVRVTKSDLPTILSQVDIIPWDVLEFFRVVVNGWVQARKSSYETICKIAEHIDKEDAMLSLVSG